MVKELKEYLNNVDGVSHITFDPKGPGVVRIHLIPPKKVKLGISWVIIINGENLLPISCGWAILLREFINNITEYSGKEVSDEEIKRCVNQAVDRVSKLFPKTDKKMLKDDLRQIIEVITNIAKRKPVGEQIGYMSLKKYARFMSAPHRMDLMISAMERDGLWHCNQKCLNCYAAREVKGKEKELSTDEWKLIIDKLKEARIPQITFTGGEPTLRKDLAELVDYSGWFVTRLNTNGRLLSKELCDSLYEASLDAVQVTLYSDKKEIHNFLVGADGFDDTIQGIKNGVDSKLLVSINTPLCTLNKDYVSLIRNISLSTGVRYFTCSGMILTGNAKDTNATRLSENELFDVLNEAITYAKNHGLEIKFTSPGILSNEKLKKLRLDEPMCGAGSSNMAISPSGDLIPCQSYLSGLSFGSLVNDDFKVLWRNKELKKLRKKALALDNKCLLNNQYESENK